jgi:tetratricopeptide (TPR) repeat protein
VRLGYGYLLECHGRYWLRQAAEQYQRAIALDPDADKPRYQLIGAQAALGEAEAAIALYTRRLADSPTQVREHRLLARAYLAARPRRGGQGDRRRAGAGPRRPAAAGDKGRGAGGDR